MEEKPERNKSIITRHYSGETLKSIAESLELSYGTTVIWAGRHREKIFARVDGGEDASIIAEEYSLSPEAIMNICQIEFDKRSSRQEREDERDRDREEEWAEYIEGESVGAFENFQNGLTVRGISEQSAMPESTVIAFIEDELSKQIRGRSEVIYNKYKEGASVESLVSEFSLSYEVVLRRIADELKKRIRLDTPV